MDLFLAGKSVIVCASSAGLGKATALEFAREGALVMLCGRREAELQRAMTEIETATGQRPSYAVADLTVPSDIARLIESTRSMFGSIYALVNNSGGPPAATFDECDDAAWQHAFDLNLLSYIRTTRAALPHLRRRGEGRIVNFTSSSVKSPLDGLILSNTFRTGVVALTKTLAGELGRDGILVNVVGPGRIHTERIDRLDDIRAKAAGTSPEQVRSEACKTIPLRRYGTPAEFAKVATFLGSPANTYVTGQTILVDGGMTKAY